MQSRPDPQVPEDGVGPGPEEHERELIRRARSGDAGAFESLYRINVGRVYALCLRMSGESERAERLTQDAFVTAWVKLSTFRGEAAFGSWLHRLTVNVVLQERRSRLRRRERIEEAAAEADSPVTRGIGPGTRIDLERAIAGLPERARLVFVLHDVEGYRHEEIAEMLGTAVGTSKAQLHRARRLLREMMGR
jgi:RNA polymerase sigma-70 factor, ECF subfamily